MHVSIEELYGIVGLSGCAECVVIGHNMSVADDLCLQLSASGPMGRQKHPLLASLLSQSAACPN